MENHIKFTREACGFCLFDLVNKELQTLKKKGEATEWLKFKFACKITAHIVQRRKLKKGQKPEKGEA